jgi:ADP-ribosylglycohydrolase
MSATSEERYRRALISLDGLSVGDAFGERFFFIPPAVANDLIITHTPPDPPWRFTDDTNMALSIVSILRQHGEIDQDLLALSFAEHYTSSRGYGTAMHHLLPLISMGASWKNAAPSLFGGQGSYGNGSAMRVAPLGAYFADDLDAVVENARRSAQVTHAHREGAAGAIAVAVGAALAWQAANEGSRPTRQEFLDSVIPWIPTSAVRHKVQLAQDLEPDASVRMAVEKLGNGSSVTAQDTVPFVLWCAGGYLDDFEEALWRTVFGAGDIDTTCAMVGGIVAAYTGREDIPEQWLQAREPLPAWPFEES